MLRFDTLESVNTSLKLVVQYTAEDNDEVASCFIPFFAVFLSLFLPSFFLSSCLPGCGLPGVTRARRNILTPSVEAGSQFCGDDGSVWRLSLGDLRPVFRNLATI